MEQSNINIELLILIKSLVKQQKAALEAEQKIVKKLWKLEDEIVKLKIASIHEN